MATPSEVIEPTPCNDYGKFKVIVRGSLVYLVFQDMFDAEDYFLCIFGEGEQPNARICCHGGYYNAIEMKARVI